MSNCHYILFSIGCNRARSSSAKRSRCIVIILNACVDVHEWVIANHTTCFIFSHLDSNHQSRPINGICPMALLRVQLSRIDQCHACLTVYDFEGDIFNLSAHPTFIASDSRQTETDSKADAWLLDWSFEMSLTDSSQTSHVNSIRTSK